jgi:hypothetical protein
MSQTQIARLLGFTAAYVHERAARLNLPPRGGGTHNAAAKAYLAAEAERRGLSLRKLRALIIATISHDRIVGAVLDDEDRIAAAAAAKIARAEHCADGDA